MMKDGILLAVVLRWAHILAAVVAVGGAVFMRFVVAPSVRASLDPEQHARLHEQVVPRWRRIFMICIGVLLLSGLANFFLVALPKAEGVPLYHALFGVKFLLAMAVFFLGSALVGRSAAFERLRADTPRWLAVTIVLAVVVILISGVLRYLG